MVTAKPEGDRLTPPLLGSLRRRHMQQTAIDPVRDLMHIVCLTGDTFGLAARVDAPDTTWKEMVA